MRPTVLFALALYLLILVLLSAVAMDPVFPTTARAAAAALILVAIARLVMLFRPRAGPCPPGDRRVDREPYVGCE
ncbi:MAG TPA: hypothetical protein VGB92_25980 [Longimicrobium sp.]|jgi:hypothetical protein